MRRSIVLAVVIAVAVVAGSVAHATAPGKNGKIAFRRFVDRGHTRGALFATNLDGTGVQQLTHPPRGTVDDQPDWSPDGSRIVFERCPSNSVCRVVTIRPDGGAVRYLTPGCPPGQGPPKCIDIRGPAYSPDGNQIVYGIASGSVRNASSGDSDQIQRFSLDVMDADGRHSLKVIQLANWAGDLDRPQFSPDG
jgi:TolB protein